MIIILVVVVPSTRSPYWLVDFDEHGMSIQAGPVFERRVPTFFF